VRKLFWDFRLRTMFYSTHYFLNKSVYSLSFFISFSNAISTSKSGYVPHVPGATSEENTVLVSLWLADQYPRGLHSTRHILPLTRIVWGFHPYFIVISLSHRIRVYIFMRKKNNPHEIEASINTKVKLYLNFSQFELLTHAAAAHVEITRFNVKYKASTKTIDCQINSVIILSFHCNTFSTNRHFGVAFGTYRVKNLKNVPQRHIFENMLAV